MKVIFYEKPGCVSNAKQKRSLEKAGCILIVKNLLHHGMNDKELLRYLEKRPVAEWFNPNAPAVKKKQIDPHSFTKKDALPLLIANPILIRRPLLNVEGTKMCGFDVKAIEKILGKDLDLIQAEKCSSTTACSSPVSSSSL